MRPDLSVLMSSTAANEWLALLSTGERLFAIDAEYVGHQARAGDPPQPGNAIAVLRLDGSLYPRGDYGGSMERFRSRINAAAGNSEVGAIVLDISSPGGTVAGTPETAEAVRQAAMQKPVVALADSLAASAAYWIGSQASSFWVAPSAYVGSIGVIGMHLDISQALADNGVKPTLITAGKYKGERTMFAPLSEEARDAIQAEADREHAGFIRAVAQGRKTSQERVAAEFGQGRTVDAQNAVRLGMADKVGTMSDVLASLRTKSGGVRRRSALAFA